MSFWNKRSYKSRNILLVTIDVSTPKLAALVKRAPMISCEAELQILALFYRDMDRCRDTPAIGHQGGAESDTGLTALILHGSALCAASSRAT